MADILRACCEAVSECTICNGLRTASKKGKLPMLFINKELLRNQEYYLLTKNAYTVILGQLYNARSILNLQNQNFIYAISELDEVFMVMLNTIRKFVNLTE
ncbi:hypothetical protein ILUMI_22493 [Ignelater luminosus]|uniref:Uncharacterized protein n=1 Tax=Ignelater luminosus TaxID=2038154 RepID=A0A8K0G2V2_IGNLU|nr:hypothetical protein ILUMI_22493 [Ignelater luminosus]